MTKPYKRGKRYFMYDEKDCVVWNVARMTEQDKKENVEWLKTHNKPLFETDESGEWMILDGVGLMRENWRNKSKRNSYLDQWNDELEEELSYLIDDLREEFGL